MVDTKAGVSSPQAIALPWLATRANGSRIVGSCACSRDTAKVINGVQLFHTYSLTYLELAPRCSGGVFVLAAYSEGGLMAR